MDMCYLQKGFRIYGKEKKKKKKKKGALHSPIYMWMYGVCRVHACMLRKTRMKHSFLLSFFPGPWRELID